MGSANSPSCTAQYRLAILRMLKDNCPLYQGTSKENCWWTGFQDLGFHLELGYGLILEGDNGLPGVKIWAWIDDFLIHRPTRKKTTEALKYFLETTGYWILVRVRSILVIRI